MATVIAERMTAKVEEERVLFLVGMRINRPWKLHKWLPVFLAMTRMLKELRAHPEYGLLEARKHFSLRSPLVVQYWESFEKLEAYAGQRDSEHLPAWATFNRKVASNGDVGIWHETYRITPGSYECIYNNMPAYGFGKAAELVPARGAQESAGQRMGVAETPSGGDDRPAS